MNQKDLANTMMVQKVTANFDYTKATLHDKTKRRGQQNSI